MEGGYFTLADYWADAAPNPQSRAIKACYVGADAVDRLTAFAREHCGEIAHIVIDVNTLAAAGDSVHLSLADVGKHVGETCFGAEPLDATAELGDEVASDAEGADFLVGIGAGTISDLAKYAGNKLNRPVLLFPTAASMNGYTSGIVALKVNGLKRTLPCTPAAGIFADPAVAATAPQRMVAAGIADFLSKCSSATDWRVGYALRSGYYTEEPRKLFTGTTERVLCAAQRIGRGETAAYATVLDALMLSGYSMVLAGSSAPASGGEHLISHYLDMKSALYGMPHDL
ncbi:MAG: iron-containing alcohol dehydrogenase, partial [Candidatus Hydrogenedentales bacterium]